jgi:hypothetical protein
VIAEQNFGWYIEPTVEQLCQALAELFITAPTDLAAMGERGRQYAAENLSISAVRQLLLDMYSSAIRCRSATTGGQRSRSSTQAARSS